MEPRDLTVEILEEIRDELRTTRTELRAEIATTRTDLREELGNVRAEVGGLGARVERLEGRAVETETRLATELVAVVAAVHEVRDAIVEDRHLRQAVDDHEHRLRALERRLPT